MTGTINIDTRQLDQLVALWQKAPEMTERAMFAGLYESTLLAESNIKANTPKGVGGAAGLMGSIAANAPVKTGTGLVGIVSTSLNYAPAVELGSKPHFPPLLPLVGWVEEVLNITGSQARQVAFAIARKISRVGTKGQFMFKKGMEQSDAQFKRIFDQTVNRIKQGLVQ